MHVNVVMGGPSAEYDVSIVTGREMIAHLGDSAHRLRAVVIGADRSFYYADIDGAPPPLEAFSAPDQSDAFAGPFAPQDAAPVWEGCEVALLGVHGSLGEDGRLQGYLEVIGIPYTGSGVYASAIAMNKIATKHLFEQNGITTPPYSVYGPHHDTTVDEIEKRHGYPCYAKCPQSGSSKLMGRADSREELDALLEELRAYADDILIETAVEGVELSCPVVSQADGTLVALPPVEIRPVKSAYFDYEAKYTDGACEELVPAPQPESLLEAVKDTSLRLHRLLNCNGVSRTDFIYTGTDLHVLEINTLPGFTPASLVPKSYEAAGGTYAQLLETLIEEALVRRTPVEAP